MNLSKVRARLRLSTFRAVNRLAKSTKRMARRIICLVLLINLLIWPTTGLAYELGELASSAVRSCSWTVTTTSLRMASYLLRVLLLSPTTQLEETTLDRTARVRTINIAPSKIVGYTGQHLKFSAVGGSAEGKTIQGVQFTWSSSDAAKVNIDSLGMATLNGTGLVWVTATTPNATARVPILIRPGPRPEQSDNEWRLDQGQLRPDGSVVTAPGNGVGRLLDSVVERLLPSAHAQTGGADSGDFLYDELWSEPRNLVGSPRNRIMTASAIGGVLPEGSNFEFSVPLYGLSGRGVSAGIALNYNSRIWSRHGSAVTFNAINSWPYLGFSLSFGRIVTYGPSSTTKFVLIDGDGTRHYLGTGAIGTSATYQSNDGSHITYVGDGTTGGCLLYNNGLKKGVVMTNNRLLVRTIEDANGNCIDINYVSQSYPAYSCPTGNGYKWEQAIDYITDALGRVIQFNYDACNNLTSIDVPGYEGTAQNPVTTTIARFDYTTALPSTSFSGLTVENVPGVGGYQAGYVPC